MKHAIIRDDWALCPIHGAKLCRIEPDGRARGIKLWCKQCRAEIHFEL